MTFRERLFGPSLRTRLLDQLDLQQRQMHADRSAWREALSDMQDRSLMSQQAVIALAEKVAATTVESSKSFSKYLDLITPKGNPELHPMNDQLEAHWEKQLLKDRADYQDALKDEGPSIDMPIAEQLHYADSLVPDLSALLIGI